MVFIARGTGFGVVPKTTERPRVPFWGQMASGFSRAPFVYSAYMSQNFLESIGLLPGRDADYELVSHVDVLGMDLSERPVNGLTQWGIYPDPSGANIGYAVTTEDVGLELFSLRATHPNRTLVRQLTPGLAEVQIVNEDEEATSKVLVAVDDPAVYPDPASGDPFLPAAEYRIGAIAVELSTFDTVEEWRKTQEPIDANGETIYLGPGFIASPWLFELAKNPQAIDHANPIAVLNAECQEVELVTNELTGNSWYRVEIDCGFPLTLGMPADSHPEPGKIIDGQVFLTGSTGHWYA